MKITAGFLLKCLIYNPRAFGQIVVYCVRIWLATVRVWIAEMNTARAWRKLNKAMLKASAQDNLTFVA